MTNTRDKLNEAFFFLSQMKGTTDNKDAFRYNLSACVSALRSTTLFMQEEYAHVTNFPSWYSGKQVQMKADKISVFFNKQRVLTIHKKPLATRAQYQFYSPAIDLTKLAPGVRITFNVTSSVDENGKPTVQVNDVVDPSNAMSGEFSAETQWLFDELSQEDNPHNKDVLTLCEEQLHEIQEIVSECEQLFPIGKNSSLTEEI
jgi:hypothetical protein